MLIGMMDGIQLITTLLNGPYDRSPATERLVCSIEVMREQVSQLYIPYPRGIMQVGMHICEGLFCEIL